MIKVFVKVLLWLDLIVGIFYEAFFLIGSNSDKYTPELLGFITIYLVIGMGIMGVIGLIASTICLMRSSREGGRLSGILLLVISLLMVINVLAPLTLLNILQVCHKQSEERIS